MMSKNIKPGNWMKPFVKVAWLLPIMSLVVTGLACGEGTNTSKKVPEYPHLILDGSTSVITLDYRAILDADELPGTLLDDDQDTIDFQEELIKDWSDPLIGIEDITGLATAFKSSGSFYYDIIKTHPDFDFDDLRDDLEDEGYEETTYRNLEVWERERTGSSVSLFEEDGVVVFGETENVRELLKAIDREEGFIDDESNLGRVMQAAGKGLTSFIIDECEVRTTTFTGIKFTSLGGPVPGCEATATTISDGDEDTTQATLAAVFRSERRAEAGAEDLKENIEDSNEVDADIEDMQIKGDMVILKLTLHE